VVAGRMRSCRSAPVCEVQSAGLAVDLLRQGPAASRSVGRNNLRGAVSGSALGKSRSWRVLASWCPRTLASTCRAPGSTLSWGCAAGDPTADQQRGIREMLLAQLDDPDPARRFHQLTSQWFRALCASRS
jgi:hypothetical protein